MNFDSDVTSKEWQRKSGKSIIGEKTSSAVSHKRFEAGWLGIFSQKKKQKFIRDQL